MASVKLKLPPPPCGPVTMNRFGKPLLCRPRNVLVPSVCHFSLSVRPLRPVTMLNVDVAIHWNPVA